MKIPSGAPPPSVANLSTPGTLLLARAPRQSTVPLLVHSLTQWNGYMRHQCFANNTNVILSEGAGIGSTDTGLESDATDDDGPAQKKRQDSLANGSTANRFSTVSELSAQRRFRNLYADFKFKIPSANGAVTDRRWRFGIYAAGFSITAQNPGAACIEFVADATRDTTWQFATHDGTTYSIVDTGIAFAADDLFRFFQFGILSDGNAWYRVNNGPAVSKATNLPPDSTVLETFYYYHVMNTTGSTVGSGPAVNIYRSGIWW
jgi:hypothetical protein